MIHFFEGPRNDIIDEETGLPIPQKDLFVKMYCRSNPSEIKDASIIRYVFFIESDLMTSPPLTLEKTVLHLIHNCFRCMNKPDPRLKYEITIVVGNRIVVRLLHRR